MSGTLNRAAHYQVHERLATGGMGEVYFGTMSSPAGDRPVAVKQVAAGHLQLQEAVDRLIAEAKLGFQLRHANICQVLDLVLGDHGAFLILEFVEGMNLRELTKASDGYLDVSVALHAARETARALDYAHRARSGEGNALHTVHGDVTPQNILLSVEGEVKLADFGIARALGSASPGSDVVGGTLGFMAPEVITGNTDHRSDIYSLGATLHYALVGEAPKSPGDISALHRRSDLSAALKRILARCLAFRADERYSSAAELEGQIALEMARRFPEFTASVAAAKVRTIRRSPAHALGGHAKTLFTIGLSQAPVPLNDANAPTRVDAPWLRAPENASLNRSTASAAHGSPGTVTMNSQLQAPLPAQHTATMAGHLVTSPPGNGTQTMASQPVPLSRSLSTGILGQIPMAASPKTRRSTLLGVLILGALIAIVGILLSRSASHEETASRVAQLPTADGGDVSKPAHAIVHFDAGSAREITVDATASPIPDAGPLEPVAPSATAKSKRVNSNQKRHNEKRKSAELEPAFLTVNSTPWGAVEVDGAIVTQETPLLRHSLTPGRHRVRVVFGDGSRSKMRRIHLKSGQSRNLGFVK